MSLPSRAYVENRVSLRISNLSRAAIMGCFGVGADDRMGSGIYPGEDGGPDGLNLLDLGGTEDGLDLVGLDTD